MTSAELKYLIAVKDLIDINNKKGVKLTDVAIKMGVSKVSVYRAMDRLEKSNYVTRDEKGKIVILDYGYNQLEIYLKLIGFIRKHLEVHCNTPNDIALNDAIGAVCALSDESRNGIARHMNNCKLK